MTASANADTNFPISASSPLVIPEIGINHGGDLDVAFSMVDSAFRAGAQLVKHQTHIPDAEMSAAAKAIMPGNADEDIYSVISKNSLTLDQEKVLAEYVRSKGLEYISTPFSYEAAVFLHEVIDVPFFKIGSGECNNRHLVKKISEFQKPMIVSTGMNTLQSIRQTVDILDSSGIKFALMHTTNLYPTPDTHVRLGGMLDLMKEFKDVPIGLSDHTTDNLACIAALALGAQLVERHFTDKKERVGPDICCSMDESELSALLKYSTRLPSMLGGNKEPHSDETVTSDFAFQSVVSLIDIKPGEKFSMDNIGLKRPGTGSYGADDFVHLINKTATQLIEADVQLTPEMVQ